MIASFIILFREILEISIILSVVLAATEGVCGRTKYVLLGLLGGIAGSAVVAVFAENITAALEGVGQEVFSGSVLLLAAAMIGWTTVWMKKHGRELSMRLKHMGARVSDGSLPLTSIAVVVALTMWREGAEIALFMAGIISTTKEGLASVLTGAAAGGGAAAIVGALIYYGLITLSSRHLFTVTGWMLILLASGMASAAAGFLVAADVLPALGPQLWDSSGVLAEDSIPGKVLHAMFGYSERPAGIQLVFYVATFVIIYTASKLVKSPAKPAAKAQAA